MREACGIAACSPLRTCEAGDLLKDLKHTTLVRQLAQRESVRAELDEAGLAINWPEVAHIEANALSLLNAALLRATNGRFEIRAV